MSWSRPGVNRLVKVGWLIFGKPNQADGLILASNAWLGFGCLVRIWVRILDLDNEYRIFEPSWRQMLGYVWGGEYGHPGAEHLVS